MASLLSRGHLFTAISPTLPPTLPLLYRHFFAAKCVTVRCVLRCLNACAESNVLLPEFPQFLPVRQQGLLRSTELIPVHVRTRPLQRVRSRRAKRTPAFIAVINLHCAGCQQQQICCPPL